MAANTLTNQKWDPPSPGQSIKSSITMLTVDEFLPLTGSQNGNNKNARYRDQIHHGLDLPEQCERQNCKGQQGQFQVCRSFVLHMLNRVRDGRQLLGNLQSLFAPSCSRWPSFVPAPLPHSRSLDSLLSTAAVLAPLRDGRFRITGYHVTQPRKDFMAPTSSTHPRTGANKIR